MKTIKNSKDITTLKVGDVVAFGALMYVVDKVFNHNSIRYYLTSSTRYNGIIFERLNLKKRDFIEKLGIDADCYYDFPEVKSLEALTTIVSALFKEWEKQNELPKTWEEFCKHTPIQKGECFIGVLSELLETQYPKSNRDPDEDKNYCTSKQEAQAFRALIQLRQLRKAYVKDWEPDWTCDSTKFCIIVDVNRIRVADHYFCSRPLSFPTYDLAEQFLNNFKDLLAIAKPLL